MYSEENIGSSSFDPAALWEQTLSDLRKELDPHIYKAYIDPLKLSTVDSTRGEFVVSAPSKLVCTHVEQSFGGRFSEMLSRLSGNDSFTVRFAVDPDSAAREGNVQDSGYVVVKKIKVAPVPAVDNRGSRTTPLNSTLVLGQRTNPKYTFKNYVVGSGNQFCHAAAMRVAENPGNSYNPLFIYGGVGLGKTHLLHAIGNAVLESRPNARVLYMSSEAFTNALIQALRLAKMDEFKDRLRNIELLLIDDIQFMRGKERTQEEFFHTFNVLYAAKQQIVITSDKLPVEIPGIEERLRTRFAWGLTADIQAPDFETRVAILKRKANLDNFQLPPDVAEFIAENFSSNVRELEGALTRLHAVCSLQSIELSLALATSALKPLLQPKTINVSVDDIKKAVAQHFNIKVSDMVSKRRTKNLSFPRHIAMYLCRKHTTCSYPEIGSNFGNRDHSSVIHAANVVSNKISSDQEIRTRVDEIERRLFSI